MDVKGDNTFPLHNRLPNPIWLRRPFPLALADFIRYFPILLEQIKTGGDYVVVPSVQRARCFSHFDT